MRATKLIELITPPIVALTLMLAPYSPLIFFYTSLIVSVIVIIRWLKYIQSPENIELADFFSSCIYSAYALTTLTTQFNLFSSGYGYASEFFLYDQFYLSAALATIIASCFVLEIYGLARPTRLKTHKKINLENSKKIELFIIVSFLIIIYCILKGQIGFQGNIHTTENTSRISPLAAISIFLIPLIGAISFYLACSEQHLNKNKKIVFYAISFFMLMILFTQGRRLLIFSGILYLISYRLTSKQKILTPKNFLYFATVIIVAYIGFQFFFALRLATYQSKGSISELIPIAFDILQNKSYYDFSSQLSENVLSRPFIIGYVSHLIELTNPSNYFWGGSFLNNLQWTIPSFLLSNKQIFTDEELIHPRLGLPITDQANSIITAGIADFGIFGAIIFPTIFIALTRFFIHLTFNLKSSWISFISWLAFLHLFLSVESTLTSFLLTFRSLLILFLIYYMILFSRKTLAKKTSTRKTLQFDSKSN